MLPCVVPRSAPPRQSELRPEVRPEVRPPQARPPPVPQLTPDSFPPPASPPQSAGADFDNFIPDFDPQEELQAFMNSIGDDFKDFNFDRDSQSQPSQAARPVRRPARKPSRPVVGGFHPISGDLRPPGPPRNKRRHGGGQRLYGNSIRRGDGFGPDGEPGGLENTRSEHSRVLVLIDDQSRILVELSSSARELMREYAGYSFITVDLTMINSILQHQSPHQVVLF